MLHVQVHTPLGQCQPIAYLPQAGQGLTWRPKGPWGQSSEKLKMKQDVHLFNNPGSPSVGVNAGLGASCRTVGSSRFARH
jgi:hypothetical protein